MSRPLNIIGKSRPRVDGRARVTGQTRFAGDISLPRTLHCRLLRSHLPHAKIRRIDVSRAKSSNGVHCVLTGADMPIAYGIIPISEDEHALCIDKVRYIGDPVAAVVAVDEESASAALELIDVDYEPLRTIATLEDALAPSEQPIHDYVGKTNIQRMMSWEFGDANAVIDRSQHVFDDVFFYGGNTHLALEQHASLATLDAEGRLVIYSSTQTPHYLHRGLARVLGIPASRIRVIAPPNGGGFGGKSEPFNHEFIVCKAALLTGRPVRICLSREEVFYCHRGRHPVSMRLRTGVDEQGNITGMHLQTLLDGGAYGSYGAVSTIYTGALQTLTYKIPAYRWDGCRVFTNKAPCGPKRGHGTPQSRFAQEVQLDKIACRLGIDPAELRLRQLVDPDTLTANFLEVGTTGLRDCIDRVIVGSGWHGRRGQLPFGRGLGLATSGYLTGAATATYPNDLPFTGVQLKLDRAGGVTAFCGATEIGQGSDDVLASVVAEVLGIEPDAVRLVTGDTDLTPVDLGSYSSRVSLMMGHAALQAAESARAYLASSLTRRLGIPVTRLVFAGGRVFDSEDPDRGFSFEEAVTFAEADHGTLGTVGSYTPPDPKAKYTGVGPSPAFSFTACVVEVDVDPETGWLTVLKVWIAHDLGRALNPTLARGQIEGSVYMGLGEVLMEETAYRRLPPRRSPALVQKAPSMLDYKSPTFLDMPEIVTYLVEHPDENGPFGAKEVGQGPLLPVMPAVANAVYAAVGVRIDEIPITPEKILKALETKRRNGVDRYGPATFPVVPWAAARRIPTPAEGGDGNAAVRLRKRPSPASEGR